jgi:cold shock CspA family protein
MRTHGKITRWNDERGFGFIAPAGATSDVFVHISSFPRDGTRPQVGELISFMVETGPDGRQRAIGVMRPGQRAAPRPSTGPKRQPAKGRKRTGLLTLAVIAGLGIYAWSEYEAQVQPAAAADWVAPEDDIAPAPSYSCDGRTMCSQMRSCDEATYFIRNCPNTQMDGDNDGVPCESQWCD